jgi:hypothetical protein
VIGRVPDWARLFRIARSLILQANARQVVIESWSFGGGTAMMLQIGHRESHDVDIFLDDPQLLPFLDPKLHDFDFEIRPSDYTGDGASFLKLAFDDVGEIDFIVGRALTETPTTEQIVEGEPVALETVGEIIAKKVHFRGSSIRPRDIFDIAAAATHGRQTIIDTLKAYKNDVARTLVAIERLNPDFVNATIADLAIKPSYRSLAPVALEEAKEILRAV